MTAFAYGISNFSGVGYPEPDCQKPHPPFSNDEFAWSRFEMDLQQYEACMEAYINACRSDADSITRKEHSARRELSNSMQSARFKMQMRDTSFRQ